MRNFPAADQGPHGGSEARTMLLRLSKRTPCISSASSMSACVRGRAILPESFIVVLAASTVSLIGMRSNGFTRPAAGAVSIPIETGMSLSLPFRSRLTAFPASILSTPLSKAIRIWPPVFESFNVRWPLSKFAMSVECEIKSPKRLDCKSI